MRVRGPDDCTPVGCLRSCSTSTSAQLLTACSRGRRTVRSCGRLLVRPAISSDFRGSFSNWRPILRVYEFLRKLLSSLRMQYIYGKMAQIELMSQHSICVVYFSAFLKGKSQKLCRVPTFIGIGTVSIIATSIIPILWSESKQCRKQ